MGKIHNSIGGLGCTAAVTGATVGAIVTSCALYEDMTNKSGLTPEGYFRLDFFDAVKGRTKAGQSLSTALTAAAGGELSGNQPIYPEYIPIKYDTRALREVYLVEAINGGVRIAQSLATGYGLSPQFQEEKPEKVDSPDWLHMYGYRAYNFEIGTYEYIKPVLTPIIEFIASSFNKTIKNDEIVTMSIVQSTSKAYFSDTGLVSTIKKIEFEFRLSSSETLGVVIESKVRGEEENPNWCMISLSPNSSSIGASQFDSIYLDDDVYLEIITALGFPEELF